MPERPSSWPFSLLVFATAALTFALVVLGGVVRVTGSGLGCPDWPLCHGSLIPPFETATLLEYSHRLVATLVSVSVAATCLVAWRGWRNDRPVILVASLASALLVVQVALGGVTVLFELPPQVVSVHLVTAEVLLGLLVLLYCLIGRDGPAFRRNPVWQRPGPGMLWLTAAGALGVLSLIISGAYVRSTGATFICSLWPFCGPEPLPSQGLPGIHMAHRLVALVSGALIVVLLWATWQRRKAIRTGGLLSMLTAMLLASQVIVGALMVSSGFTPLDRGIHLAVATGVWMGVVALATLTWLGHFSGPQGPSLPGGEDRRAVMAKEALAGSLSAFLALTKPAIVGMLLVTALGGAFLASGGLPPLGLTLVVLLGGALTAGGANAINNYMDRDIDGRMGRTLRRPLPSRRVSPASALVFGMALTVLGFLVLAVGANVLSAALALASSGFYLLAYTGWLKRSTPQNIVIGGAAGAMPPVIAWAAITNSLTLPVLYLFLIVFFWTPPHFWALALLVQEDYARVSIPMLPVVRGDRYTFWAIGGYTFVLMMTTLIFYATGTLGMIYLASAVLLGAVFVWLVTRVLHKGSRHHISRVYRYSMLYLGLLFLAIMLDTAIRF